MRLFKDFFPSEVLVYHSERKKDFVLASDADDLTEEQKDFLSLELGFQVNTVVIVRQIHGNDIVIVDEKKEKYPIEEADGLITQLSNVPLAIRTADCVPIFVYDTAHQVMGLFHAGWKSTQAKILVEGLNILQRKWQTKSEDVKVAFGPCIHRESCEVKEFFKDYFPREVFEKEGKVYLDLPLANKHQAMEWGVKENNILDSGIDTFTSAHCFSYRRGDVEKGRMLSLMMKKG
ncbi:MAG TPA: polyphenol oxidase family protein [Candidatus Omnitrophota bacterium]|nr:polyphenol oxidase family protein [Candidatus Omnitrophota bacterium]HPN88073.1 polyphenol oxidase family protein [Candidatus Omnitrophota bacterium]